MNSCTIQIGILLGKVKLYVFSKNASHTRDFKQPSMLEAEHIFCSPTMCEEEYCINIGGFFWVERCTLQPNMRIVRDFISDQHGVDMCTS